MHPFGSLLVTRDIEGEGRHRVDAEVRAMYRDPTPCRSRRSRSIRARSRGSRLACRSCGAPSPIAPDPIRARRARSLPETGDARMIVSVSSRVSSPYLVGRSEELDHLRAAYERVLGGTPRTVLVAGEAGVGKTRLIEEFVGEVRPASAPVLVGGCMELGDGGLPFAPFVEAFRSLVRQHDTDDLDRLLGPGRASWDAWCRVSPAPRRGSRPTMRPSRRPGSSSMCSVCWPGAASEAPLLLVLEDLHWADRSTRDLIRFLVRSMWRERVLLLLTYRRDDLHRRHPLLPLLSELAPPPVGRGHHPRPPRPRRDVRPPCRHPRGGAGAPRGRGPVRAIGREPVLRRGAHRVRGRARGGDPEDHPRDRRRAGRAPRRAQPGRPADRRGGGPSDRPRPARSTGRDRTRRARRPDQARGRRADRVRDR